MPDPRAVAFAASGLADLLSEVHALADLGYLGVDGIVVTPIRKPPCRRLSRADSRINRTLARLRAPVESAVAHLKTWRMLSGQGGCYRPPIDTFATT
ncbi:transposase family protein [Nocardia sp. NPDC003482]